MSRPASRDDLIQYCLRRLGHPVIEINVDPDQVEDRIDDALQMFQAFHMDATEHVMMPYQITPTDILNKYITIPDDLVSVIGFLQVGPGGGDAMFNVNYQIHMSEWDAFYGGAGSGGLVNYDVTQRNLSLMQFMFNVEYGFDFNRHQKKLFIRWNWGSALVPGDARAGMFLVIEGYRILDPTTYSDIFNDFWLKRYCTALIRRNWGENLMKYSGTSLPGGITLNGADIYDKALIDIEKLEEEIRTTFEEPINFQVG